MAVRTWVVGMAVAAQVFACGESSTSDDDPAESGGSAGEASGGTTGGSLATGGGGASGGSLATGGGGASGGALATGGNVATGGTITMAGSGGASAGSSSGGTGGKNSNYGNPLADDPRCATFATRVAEACPNDWTYAESHLLCQDKLNELFPMGCFPEFEAFVTCEGEVNCVVGFSQSCANLYRDCANGFVEDTACVREGAGITCPEGRFAFICRLEPPSACTPTDTVGSATRACCPPISTVSRD